MEGEQTPRVVRVLGQTKALDECEHKLHLLSELLQSHGIQLTLEYCSLARLKTIAAQPSRSFELLCLLSIPIHYQSLFLRRKIPPLIMGLGDPKLSLPFITNDLHSSTRHATLSLLRRGFKRIVMLNIESKAAGVAQTVETFRKTCETWTHPLSHVEEILIWNDFLSMQIAFERLAAKIKGDPYGILVFSPLSVGILVTSLLQRGIAIPKQVEIMAMEHQEETLRFSVPITHYASPAVRSAKELLHVALHYFETGTVQLVQKMLPMKVNKLG
jgi:DNA-binding LacI/PurR family transcriptional regulator